MMTNDVEIITKLIDFYSERSTEEGDRKPGRDALLQVFGVKNVAELTSDSRFNKNYFKIHDLRRELDHSREGLSRLEEVRSCLRLLKNKKKAMKNDELEILTKLIHNNRKKCLYNDWSKQQKDLYDQVLPIIVKWKDFFFSFTKGNLPATNNDFSSLIDYHFKEGTLLQKKDDQNLLAQLIVQLLNRRLKNAFFDEDHMKNGDTEYIHYGNNVEDKLSEHCQLCYAFIQLIEETTLTKKEENWCYKEFDKFDVWANKDKNRQFYIILHGEDLTLPANKAILEDYHEWKQRIKETRYLVLTAKDNSEPIEFRRKIYALAEDIGQTREKILEQYVEGN